MNFSVNGLLEQQKELQKRLTQLTTLESSSTTKTTWQSFGDRQGRIEEPTYDIKMVDKKIVKINKAIRIVSSAIKHSNDITMIDVDLNFDDLLSEIE